MRMGIGFVALGDLDIVGEPASSGEYSGELPFCTDIVLPCGTVGPMNCDPSMGPSGPIAQRERSQQAMDRQANRFS